ncbi:EthD family reductase [Rhodococcus sp. T2V]|uniref:EthD family reductase n=1 Tax=Rhodococcus sp. T2V TaxID=3034164 RepID=UPI0023E269EE|nr:EthD family reductase [Rhodococcus sp. T2V]MDF3306457.1 EthD family reductase [Rhodococcus sp. T2V]
MTVKVVALIKSKDAISRDEFLNFWQVEHPAFVWEMPGVVQYVQSPAIEHRKGWPYSGMAELYFDTVADVATAFRSPAADALREHEHHFIEDIQWFLASETPVPQPVPVEK